MKDERMYIKGLEITEDISEVTSKQENEEADKFTIQLKSHFSFLTFDKKDFDSVFQEILKIQLSNEKQLVGSGYRNVSWEVVKFDDKTKEGEVNAKVTISTATSLNGDFLKSRIVTLSVQELRDVLAKYPEVELDHVSFFPPLLISSIPSNERNVNVVVKYIER